MGLWAVLLSLISEVIIYEAPQAIAVNQYSKPIVIEQLEEKCESIYDYGCSCMVGLKNKGYPVGGLDAKDLQANSFKPHPKDIILFYYAHSDTYHAGMVDVLYPSGNMEVYDCNYKPGVCGKRLVMGSDPAIRGYITNPNFLLLSLP